MKRKILALIASALLLLTFAPAASASTCTQLIYFADGTAGSGGQTTFCAEDYPAVRTPPTSASFDGNFKFNNGVNVDDHITSYKFASGALPGIRVRLFAQYYFNGTGDYIELVNNDAVWHNLPSARNNTGSSFAGCGTSCSDDPS